MKVIAVIKTRERDGEDDGEDGEGRPSIIQLREDVRGHERPYSPHPSMSSMLFTMLRVTARGIVSRKEYGMSLGVEKTIRVIGIM